MHWWLTAERRPPGRATERWRASYLASRENCRRLGELESCGSWRRDVTQPWPPSSTLRHHPDEAPPLLTSQWRSRVSLHDAADHSLLNNNYQFSYRAILLAISFPAAFIQEMLRPFWRHSDAIMTPCRILQTIRTRITFNHFQYHRNLVLPSTGYNFGQKTGTIPIYWER